MHLVAVSARTALGSSLSAGQAGDGPQGRWVLRQPGPAVRPGAALCMDRAYEGQATRPGRPGAWLRARGTTLAPAPGGAWEYDRVLYRRRNEVERLFRRLKSYRRGFTRYDKLERMRLAFVHLALIFDALR